MAHTDAMRTRNLLAIGVLFVLIAGCESAGTDPEDPPEPTLTKSLAVYLDNQELDGQSPIDFGDVLQRLPSAKRQDSTLTSRR